MYIRSRNLPCGSDSSALPRLVINSHVRYNIPLQSLFMSLHSNGFADWCRVLLVLGGHTEDIAPRRSGNITIVKTTRNAYDYTALGTLYDYRDSPLVCADSYLYIHDTTHATLTFNTKFKKLSVRGNKIKCSAAPHANIVAFGHQVILNYNKRFHLTLNKIEAVNIEFDNKRGLTSFGAWETAEPRIEVGAFDVYRTGFPRTAFEYKSFGIIKFVLWGLEGDIGPANITTIYKTQTIDELKRKISE